MKKCISHLLVLLFCKCLNAQEFVAEIRPRGEFRNGYRIPFEEGDQPAFFVSQRTRLGFKWESNTTESLILVQDVRVWGAEKFNTFQPSLAIHEAWFNWKPSFRCKIKMGRQTLNFDNKRILSSSNWNQSSKKHDAIYVNYWSDSWHIDYVTAFNQSSERVEGTGFSDVPGNYKYLNTLWISKEIRKTTITGMGLADGFEPIPDSTFSRFTTGAIAKYKAGNTTLTGRAFLQRGKVALHQHVNSWMLNLEATTLLTKGKLFFGIEILSGNELVKTNGISHTFEMPYGAKHAFNGSMDYFKKSSDTKNCGLTDRFINYNIALRKSMHLDVGYHWFSTTTQYTVDDMLYSRYLASELDVKMNWKLYPEIQLECGISFFNGSETLKEMKGGSLKRINHWAYVMLTYAPKIINQ